MSGPTYKEACLEMADEINKAYSDLNKLCNKLDSAICLDSERLSGRPCTHRTVLHGSLGELWQAVSKARTIAMDLSRSYAKEASSND